MARVSTVSLRLPGLLHELVTPQPDTSATLRTTLRDGYGAVGSPVPQGPKRQFRDTSAPWGIPHCDTGPSKALRVWVRTVDGGVFAALLGAVRLVSIWCLSVGVEQGAFGRAVGEVRKSVASELT